MSEAFIAFIRSEDQVLLMQRSDEIGDLPGAWDGVYGAGDPSDLDSMAARIEECTGLEAGSLTYVRSVPHEDSHLERQVTLQLAWLKLLLFSFFVRRATFHLGQFTKIVNGLTQAESGRRNTQSLNSGSCMGMLLHTSTF